MTNDLKIRWFCSQVSMLKNHMYALAIGILKNEADAEDAIQTPCCRPMSIWMICGFSAV